MKEKTGRGLKVGGAVGLTIVGAFAFAAAAEPPGWWPTAGMQTFSSENLPDQAATPRVIRAHMNITLTGGTTLGEARPPWTDGAVADEDAEHRRAVLYWHDHGPQPDGGTSVITVFERTTWPILSPNGVVAARLHVAPQTTHLRFEVSVLEAGCLAFEPARGVHEARDYRGGVPPGADVLYRFDGQATAGNEGADCPGAALAAAVEQSPAPEP